MGLETNTSNYNQTPSSSSPSSSTPPIIPTGPHDLVHLTHYDPQTPCSGCGLKSSGFMFTCKTITCSSKYLHRQCAEFHQACGKLPKSFTHSSHGTCALSITDHGAQPGMFNCNGCSQPGDRWSYHCARCRYNLHINCVIKPLRIRHQAHASCELHLSFRGPYNMAASSGFLCNACNKFGLNQWRYRCNSCDFDIHMDCAMKPPQMIK